MSLRAPFVDAAQSIDPTNPNIFFSYYPYGAVIALALDMELRQHFPQLSLDDYMRQLWRNFGKTERSYRPDDLRIALGQVTGDQAFADRFFARSITASGLPDFAPLLNAGGADLRRKNPNAAWAGGMPGPVEGVMQMTAATIPGTPLYDAGLDKGDRIVSVDGRPLADQKDWTAVPVAPCPRRPYSDRLSPARRRAQRHPDAGRRSDDRGRHERKHRPAADARTDPFPSGLAGPAARSRGPLAHFDFAMIFVPSGTRRDLDGLHR